MSAKKLAKFLNENMSIEERLDFLDTIEENYDNPWTFNGRVFKSVHITAFPKSLEGFVYLITNVLNNKEYIGKKAFWQRRKKKPTKKDPKSRRITQESDWKEYYSSSDLLQKDVERDGKENFKREILYLCGNKKSMTLLEAVEQFKREVLFYPDKYYNMTILGKFFFRDGELVERSTIGAKIKLATSPLVTAEKEGKTTYLGKLCNTCNGTERHISDSHCTTCRPRTDSPTYIKPPIPVRTQEWKDKISQAHRGKIKSYLTKSNKINNPMNNPEIREKARATRQKTDGKDYIITFPDLHEETIHNLKLFCQNTELSYPNMRYALQNNKSYKDFKIRKLEE